MARHTRPYVKAQSEVKLLITYCPDTGLFTWRQRLPANSVNNRWNGKNAGKVAGWRDTHGYIVIDIGDDRFKAHRLAFFYMTGKWPPNLTDHKNGVRDDNRWCNLRLATVSQNLANSRRRVDNTSGVKGVHFDPWTGQWRAAIAVNGKQINGQRFDSKLAAHAQYIALAKKHFGEYARP